MLLNKLSRAEAELQKIRKNPTPPVKGTEVDMKSVEQL
jgi:hypothetical protein